MSKLLRTLIGIQVWQSAVLGVATFALGVQMIRRQILSDVFAWSVFVIAILGLVWIVCTTVALIRQRTWTRGSSVSLQLFHIAIAFGIFDAGESWFWVSLAVFIPAGSALVLAICIPQIRTPGRSDAIRQERAF